MSTLGQLALRVRSKNAGPFWLTIDVFFDNDAAFVAAQQLANQAVAQALGCEQVQRYVLPDLRVIKYSLVRPVVQASREDRDQHGAQYAWLLSELTL